MDKGAMFWNIIFTGFLVAGFIVGAAGMQKYLSTENKVVEGKIIKTNYVKDKNYLDATFDNGESYRLVFYQDSYYTDLTVNSKLILKIHKTSCFLESNPYNVWQIDQIIKVPDG